MYLHTCAPCIIVINISINVNINIAPRAHLCTYVGLLVAYAAGRQGGFHGSPRPIPRLEASPQPPGWSRELFFQAPGIVAHFLVSFIGGRTLGRRDLGLRSSDRELPHTNETGGSKQQPARAWSTFFSLSFRVPSPSMASCSPVASYVR